jgi:hypothetical protein
MHIILELSIKYYDLIEFTINKRKPFFEFIQTREIAIFTSKKDNEANIFTLIQLAYFLRNYNYKYKELNELNHHNKKKKLELSPNFNPNNFKKIGKIENNLMILMKETNEVFFNKFLLLKQILFFFKYLHTKNLKTIKNYQRNRSQNKTFINKLSDSFELEILFIELSSSSIRKALYKNYLSLQILYKIFEILEYTEALLTNTNPDHQSLETISKLIKSLEFGFAYQCFSTRFSEGNAKMIQHVVGYFVAKSIGSRKFKTLMYAYLDGEDWKKKKQLYDDYIQIKSAKIGLKKKGIVDQ